MSRIFTMKMNIQLSSCFITLRSETFAGRNFRGFADFWPFRESSFPRNFSKCLNRESFFPRNFSKCLNRESFFPRKFFKKAQPRKFFPAKLKKLITPLIVNWMIFTRLALRKLNNIQNNNKNTKKIVCISYKSSSSSKSFISRSKMLRSGCPQISSSSDSSSDSSSCSAVSSPLSCGCKS